MKLRVNKNLTGLENMFKLLQHTWPEEAGVLTGEHVSISTATVVEDKLQVELAGVSDDVVGNKAVTYVGTDLANFDFGELAADDAEEAKALVQAIVDTLPCLTTEVEVGDATEDEDQLVVTVAAAAGSYTVYGSQAVRVDVNEYPLDLGADLEGEELDGYDQVIPVVRSVELPEGGDVVLAEGETFQYGVQVDGEGVAALELDIHIANPQGGLNSKEQFTVYADGENPYGSSREQYDAMGVEVVYGNGSWTIDFGPQVTAALAASGEVRFYAALRGSDRAKLWGDMMAPTAEMLSRFNISFE